MNFRGVSGICKELRASYKGVYPMQSVRVFRHMHELYVLEMPLRVTRHSSEAGRIKLYTLYRILALMMVNAGFVRTTPVLHTGRLLDTSVAIFL
jgi:hypothetical protein